MSFASSGRPMNRPPNMGQPPAIMPSAVKPSKCYLTTLFLKKKKIIQKYFLGLALPRPVLSKDRTVFDRLADIVLGDGPQNRYALICRTCGSHNGMARREEFDYLGMNTFLFTFC